MNPKQFRYSLLLGCAAIIAGLAALFVDLSVTHSPQNHAPPLSDSVPTTRIQAPAIGYEYYLPTINQPARFLSPPPQIQFSRIVASSLDAPSSVLSEPPVVTGLNAPHINWTDLLCKARGYSWNWMDRSLIYASHARRCYREKRQTLPWSSKPSAKYDSAVLRSLRYLKRTQNPDGSWCTKHQVAMTALAILAYLGHCETGSSEEFGESVWNGIAFLVDTGLRNDGRLTSDRTNEYKLHEHALATHALAEAVSMCIVYFDEILPSVETTVKKAAQLIIDGQLPSGGWKDDSVDPIVLCSLNLHALKACTRHHQGPRGTLKSCRDAVFYLSKKQTDDGSIDCQASSLKSGIDSTCLTAMAIRPYQLFVRTKNSFLERGFSYLERNPPKNTALLTHLYLAPAFYHKGGIDWTTYSSRFFPYLTDSQNDDGSFKKPLSLTDELFEGNLETKIHYTTALATLILETHYRYSPVSAQ